MATRIRGGSIASSASCATPIRRSTSSRTTSCSSRRASRGGRPPDTDVHVRSRTFEDRQQGLPAVYSRLRLAATPIRTAGSPTAAISASPPRRLQSRAVRVGYAFEHRFNKVLAVPAEPALPDATTISPRPRDEGLLPDLAEARTLDELCVFGHSKILALDNQVQADFATGPLIHKVLAGFDYFDLQSLYRLSQRVGIAPIDCLAPRLQHRAPPGSLPPFILRTDRAEAGRHLPAGPGQARSLDVDADRTARPGQLGIRQPGLFPARRPLSRATTRPDTGRVGLNYLFDIGLSPYANYSTSFTPNIGADLSRQLLQADHRRGRGSRRQVQAGRVQLHGHGGRLRDQAEGRTHPQSAQSAVQRADR